MVRRAQGEPVKIGSAIPKKQKGGAKCLHFFLYIGPFVQTTSGNASKAVPSSKSDWNLSRTADSASTAKKFAITFERVKIRENMMNCRKDTRLQPKRSSRADS